MQPVTSNYYAAMAQDVREPTGLKITVGLINELAADNAALNDNNHLYYSDLPTLLTGPIPEKTYTTWEPGRWTCGGNGVLPARTPTIRQGYVSSAQAGDDGAYSTQPRVYITLSQVFTIEGLTLTFDLSHNDWPAQIHIKGTRGEEVITDEDAYPNAADWGWGGVIGAVDRIEITFVKARQSGRRARLQSIIFGDGITFLPDRLVEAHAKSEVDPITRRLSIQDFDFSILNFDKAYDPDNPQGVWNKLLDRNAVNVDVQQHAYVPATWGSMAGKAWMDLLNSEMQPWSITAGLAWSAVEDMTWGDLAEQHPSTWSDLRMRGIEEIPAAVHYLTSRSTVEDHLARFPCVDILSLLSETYYKGPLGGGNLYDLAEDILVDAGLPVTTAGERPWVLWEGLRDIVTTAPLPIDTGRNLLQMIAHAACCVIFVDREGFIHIEPADDTQHDRYFDYSEMTQSPTITKIDALKQVDVRVYKYTIPADAAREVFKETYTVAGSYPVHVEFGAACSNVQVSVNRGSVTGTAYARAWVGTITGSGDITLTVMGKRLEESYTLETAKVSSPGPNAAGEEQDNPLITDAGRAQAVGTWVRDYLLLRNTYEYTGRGALEVDPLDMIWFMTDYSEKLPGRLIRHEWDWDGTISDRSVVKGYGMANT